MIYLKNGVPHTKLMWTAPTHNMDGSPIDYELAYELQEHDNGIASFPGTLNADGRYEINIADLPPLAIGTHFLPLRRLVC